MYSLFATSPAWGRLSTIFGIVQSITRFRVFQSVPPLTQATLVSHLWAAHQKVGIPLSASNGHSLLIGATTIAVYCGLENSLIQTLGHWKFAGTRCTLAFLTGNWLPSLINWLATHSSYLAQSNCILVNLYHLFSLLFSWLKCL